MIITNWRFDVKNFLRKFIFRINPVRDNVISSRFVDLVQISGVNIAIVENNIVHVLMVSLAVVNINHEKVNISSIFLN